MRRRSPIRASHSAIALVFGFALMASSLVWADPKVEDEVVAPVIQDAKYVFSKQGGHLAVVGRKGSRMMVVVDGVAGPKVDDVITPVTVYVDPRPVQALSTSVQQEDYSPKPVIFSQDGNHFAYVARTGQDWVLYEGPGELKEVLRMPATGMVGATVGVGAMEGSTDIRLQYAGEDGKHLYFAKSSFAGYELWVDGQKQPGYYRSAGTGAECTDPMITPDGNHFAYLATMGTRPDDKRALIIDGKDAGWIAENLQYTFDYKHIVGVQNAKDGAHLIVDGKTVATFKGINAVYLTKSGAGQIALSMRHDMPNGNIGQVLWVDGKPVPPTLGETIKQVIFSPDGKHYAADCGRSGAEWVVIDGKKGQEYQSIDPGLAGLSTGMQYSPDSSKFVYVANSKGKKFVVTNEDESDAYDGVNFFFSPQGKHLVIFGMQNQNYVMTMDDKVIPLPPRAAVDLTSFQFGPDESHYAFSAGGGPNAGGMVYLDGKESGIAGRFTLSPDGKHLAIVGARPAEGKNGLFLDGNFIFPVVQGITYVAFSPDSQHLFWMNTEPVKNPTTDAFEFVTYADGKPIAHHDRSPASQAILFPHGFGHYEKLPSSWNTTQDNGLRVLSPAPEGIKRVKATPGPDTNLNTLIESAKNAGGQDAKPRH
jgi:hypothetical protein